MSQEQIDRENREALGVVIASVVGLVCLIVAILVMREMGVLP